MMAMDTNLLLPLYKTDVDDADQVGRKLSVSTYYTFCGLPIVLGDDSVFSSRIGKNFRLSLRWATLFCCGSPLLALFLCVVLSLWWNFEAVTETHCLVPNALPSISSAIGDFEPQRFIWRLLIFAHLPLSFAYTQFFRESFTEPAGLLLTVRSRSVRSLLINVACTFNCIELLSLGFVSAVTSDYNHELHKQGFTVFEIFGFLYMVLHMYLYRISGKGAMRAGAYCYRLKRRCLYALIVLMFICGYFYYRHNAYCEPYMFTMFALFEYALVVTNVSFHATVYLDFYGKSFYFV